LLGNYSTSYYYVVDTVLTYIPSLIIGPTVVPATRFRYTTDRNYVALYITGKDVAYRNILRRNKKSPRLSLRISLRTASRSE